MHIEMQFGSPPKTPGRAQLVRDDKILLVTDDGQTIDISPLVLSWSTSNPAGKMRTASIEVAGFTVTADAVRDAA